MFYEQDRQYFYNEFKNNGYEVGSYDDFKKDLNNEEDRNWYYNEAKNMGYDVGTQADFDKMVLEPAASASGGGKQVDASATTQSVEQKASTETKPQVAQPAKKQETTDKVPGLIAKVLDMIPTGVQTSNGTYQPSPEIPQPVVKGEEMPVKEEASSSSANAASPESKEAAPVTTPTGVVNNEGLMDAKLANYLENWKQRPDKQGDYFENMVADLLADGTANSNEEAVSIVKSALGRYANRSAMDVTNQVVSSLPDDTVQDAEKSIEAQWYSHGVQDKLKQEADSMGISYDDYVAQFLKPAMVQSLVNKYGPNYRNIAEGIATRLYSHDENVQDRLMNQDINDALSSVINKYVNPSVVEEYNKAQEAGSKAFNEGMEGSQYIPANLRLGTALGAQYEANEAKDPAKVLSSLQKKFGRLYRNPEFLNDMSNAAFKVMQRYGLNRTQSSDPKQFKPMINSVLKNELDQLEIKGMMPKGSAEYIMKTGLGNTIVGKITRKAVQTDYQNWLEDIANQQYQPGFWENVASGALTFAGDAWSYWLPGAAGGKLTKSMIAKAEGKLAGDLMAKGMERRVAERAAKVLIGKSKAEALKSGAVHGAVTFGGQSAISKPIDETYRTGQFDENGKIYNPSGWKIALDTLLEGTQQSALGVIMQGNTIANMLGKGRGLATNILADIGGKVADSGIMTGHQMLERMANDPNFKPTGKDAAESFLESMANLTAIGLPVMVGKYARFKDAREFNKKFDFTDQDIAELKRFGYDGLRDAFEKMGIGEYAVVGENAQRLDGQLTQKYMDLMNDKSVPEVLKAKMMAVVEGKRPSSFSPIVDSIIIQPMDNGGKVYLETLNKDGGIVERKEFSSLDEAQKADKKLEYEKTLGLASVLESQFHNEFTQEHLDGLYNKAAQKYNMGEKLTDEDKAAVYLHQNAGAIKEIIDKQQKGIILTDEEQKQVNAYRHYYDSALENSSVMREFVNTFEDSHGVARGTLRKALESKDKKYAPLVESYLKELYNSIELKREMKQIEDDKKRIEQGDVDGAKPATPVEGPASVEGSAGGQEPPVSEGSSPYQGNTDASSSQGEGGSTVNVDNSSADVITSDAFVMGQNAYKNGDSEALQAIDYNSDLAIGRLKRAFADNEKMPDIVANAYSEGKDMDLFVAQRAGSLTPAQKDAISKYVEAMDAKKGAIDALQHADDGYGEALKEQLWPYQTEDGNIVPATLDSGKQVFLKKANEYGGAFVVVPDEQGQPTIKQVSNAEIKEVGTPVSLDEYIENAVVQQKDARAQQFISQFDGSGLKPNDQVTVAMEEGDANITMTFAGYSKDGKIVLTDGKDYLPLSKEEFAAWRKNALDNTINEHLDAEDDEREQAQIKKAEADKQERYKKGIFGYAVGKPDYSDTQTDPKVAAEYLQETAGEDRKALFANIVAEKQALQKRINQLREHIANNEEWLSVNADLDPENAETRSLANKQMQGQIVDLQARFDQWNKIRSAVMTPEEAEAIKADRTKKIAEAGVNDGDGAPIEGREVAVLSDEELKKQYPTMDEASNYITSERKRIYRIQSDEVQREIDGVDDVLDRYVNGEIDLEPEQLKELNTTKAQLQARQANLTESAKDLKAQADKLKTLYRKENMEARAKAMENMTPAEQRAVKVENAIKNGNLSQLNSIYEEVRGATDFTDTEPNTIEEYVANNIGRFSLNYEGKDKAGVLSNGIKQETGLGRKDFDKLQILAKEGEGKTVPEFVHSLYDNMPEQLKQMGYSDQDIRDAFLNLISSVENYSDLKNYTLKNKVAEAEQLMRDLERQEEEMLESTTEEETTHSEAFNKIVELAKEQKEYWDLMEQGEVDPDDVPEVDVAHDIDELLKTLSDEEFKEVSDVLQNIDEEFEYFTADEYERREGVVERKKKVENVNTYEESIKEALKPVTPFAYALKSAVESGDKKAIKTAQKELTDALIASDLGHDYLSGQLAQAKLAKKKDELYKVKRATIKPLTDAIRAIESAENIENAPFADRLQNAIAETETEPTEAQKKAGNYKKGHLSFGGYDFTVETPKGVTRSGKDEQGKPWSVTMHDTYGYILGKIGVDGDHIDMFINDAADLDTFDGNVYVVDQVNPETGEFDEHKVMYGYPSEEAATEAYLANYSKGWKGLGKVTAVPKATFDKWLESSDRKTKPFRDYAMIQHEQAKKANETLPFDAPMSMDDLPFHRDVKEVKPENLTEAQKVAYDAVSTMLKKAGIPVKVVSNEDMEKVAEAQDNLAVEMLLNDPRLRFYIKTPEQKEAAKAAYDWAAKHRPDKFKQYAIVNMDNPNQPPQYFEKKDLAEKWRKYYTNAWKIGNYKAFNLNKPFEEQIKDIKGDVPSEFDPYKAESLLNKRIELEKQIKETEDSYNAKKKERAEYQNQLMQDYMDQHGLSSENDIPDDVWTDYRDKSFEKYQDTLDDLFHNYVELDNQLKAVADPGVRFLRTYHGTGAKFDKFDLSHALEGEGSETFGHGVYVTNSKEIGTDYAQRAKDKKAIFGFEFVNPQSMSKEAQDMLRHYMHKHQDVAKGLENARKDLKDVIGKFPDTDYLQELNEILAKDDNSIAIPSNRAYRYDVDIPDDNGSNYLGWNESQNFPLEKWYRLWEITHNGFSENEYFKDGGARYDIDRIERITQMKLESPENGMQKLPTLKGEELYHALEDFFDRERPSYGAELASRALGEIGFVGIKYPAGMIHGGAKEGDYNYVVFDENNAQIVDHTKFAQGKGVVYGYTDGKQIVLNQEHLNPNTPIHEYQHLWRTAAKNMNPELIEHGDKLIMQTQLFADLKQDPNYNHLTDEQICDEAFARLTGEDGAAILEQMAKDAIKENPLDTAKELSVINKLKEWLKKFWYWTLDTFTKWKPEDIKKMTLEDIRNLVLRDLANGVDPRTKLHEAENADDIKFMGSTTKKRMKDISTQLEGRELDEAQQAVADVYSGKKDNVSLTVEREDGSNKIIMRQGNDNHAGTKHSVFRHYGVKANSLNVDDLLLIPTVLKEGERKVSDNGRVAYVYVDPTSQVKYTVVTEPKNNKEFFNDFYSNKKANPSETSRVVENSTNTPEGAHNNDGNAFMDAKVDNNSETAKENDENLSVEDKIKAVSQQFGVDEADVAMYANGVKKGSTAEAARARANIKRHLLQANEDKISSFKELLKYTVPVNEALKENFGDVDAMIEERKQQMEAQRNAMEAARKRAEEEEAKRQKHLEELSLIPDDQLDKQYMDALAKGDDATAREMLDEAARRKGYDDTESSYQGVGAWKAPGNPGYESDKARRDDWESSGSDVNLEDMALGYTPQPDDYFSHPERYSQNTPHGLESVKAINAAIDAIKNGEKDVKVKVYRAVPTSVKESKLRNGDWVTPSKKYAEMHGTNRLEGKYRIIEDEVPANQLWWDGNDANEFGFDDGKEYKYKNAKNNRKLNDLVTYDDKGDVIPPSKRFNSRKSDVRFHRVTEVKSPIMEQKLQKHPDSLMKAGTYFSGGGLVEEGLKGIIDPVVAVEYDRKISGVYRNNFGQHIVTADVRDVDPKELVKHIDGEVEYFHASPVCKNYSQAKSNSGEVELDKETAKSTADFIDAVKPRVVTIENVKGYKDSEAMKIITQALDKNGYKWDVDVYNAADFGGYTSRERLIVRAVKDGELPEKPKKQPRKGGWLEAVEDILPTLTVKESGVAPWMDARLKADGIDWQKVEKPLYVMGSAYADGKIPHAYGDEILPTLRTKSGDVIIMPGGKVLRADGRVLARITGLGDDYKLPKTESLAHTIIGNGIPVQLTQGVIAPLLNKDDLSGRNVLARFGSSIFKNNWDADKQKQVSDRVVNTANKLGGAEATVYTSVDEVPDAYLSDVKNGATGWYDPTTHTVHVYLPNCADANEAERTVLHEKIGHEGMEVLLGGEDGVRKFANFVYRSVGKDVRGKIIDFANKYDPDWKNSDRMNVGTQEYIAHLAEEGPKTAEDFSLWTKIKHYLIKVLKKLGVRVPGLLNDKDLRYYLMKAGKALHVWDEMSETQQEAMMKQASNAEIKDALSDGAGKGKPRQKKGESTIQYMKRVQEWRKWQNAREDKENPEPPMFYDIDKDEAGKKEWAQLNKDWRERHHLVGEEPTGMPIRMENEEDDAYMNRIHEYEKWQAAMKDQEDPLPDMFAFEKKKQEEVKRKYEDWLAKHDLLEQQQADLDLYEGKIYPAETNPKADALEQQVMQDLAEVTSTDVSKEGAAKTVKHAVIHRRKNMEEASADDAIYINDVKNRIDKMADSGAFDKLLSDYKGKKNRAEKLAETIPYIIEAPRRLRDMAHNLNATGVFDKGHIHIQPADVEAIQPYVTDLITETAKKHTEIKKGKEIEVYDDPKAVSEVASKMAQAINANHQGEEGFVPCDGTDILSKHVLKLVKERVVPGRINYKELSPEMQVAIDSIRDWYNYTYDWLMDNHTLKAGTGYNVDYVNHIWDKEKSDPEAYATFVENRQRTKSPNEKKRTISTLMEGVYAGLVPKTTDITKMMAYYSRSNIEAWANKTMLQELTGLNVIERNEKGEVISTDPLLSSSAPFNLEQYKYFEIPGVGPVWVYNVSPKQVKVKNPITDNEKVIYSEASAGDRFGVVFDTYQSSPFWKTFDTLASSAKKLELGFSGFHAGALTEVYMVQNMVEFGPKKAMANFMKYIFVDTAKNHELPCFANPEDFQEATSHLVKFGATNDYAAADVQNMFDNMRDAMMKVQEKLKDGNKISRTVAKASMALKVVTQLLSLINKGMDRALWDFLHDGLKLATYRMRADKTKERAKKKGWTEEELSRALDEDGQFVNDMFGGQHWDVLGASHRTLRYAGRVLLSPDWNASTTRHFLALTGFGSIWNEATFENFKQYYKRLKHKELTPEDEGRRSRQISALLCYGIGFMVFYEGIANGINAAFRALDEEKERKKAEEIRKTNPSYKSMYELAYGDEGMKWYDYLMRGNSLGQQSKIFLGRYEDGTEMYVRHGKQFREVPEYLFNHKGELEFPGPMVQRMIGKANPMVRMTLDDINYLSDFQASHADQEIQRKYGKTIGLLYKDALYWAPFLIPSQENKEFKAVDFFFPSSKGFSSWKAQSYFKDFILSGDMEGVVMTYQSCQRNGIDPEAQIKAAIGSVKALESAEMSDGVTSLQEASKRFDAAKSITEKKKMRQKMKKFLSQSDYKAFTQKEALDMVQGYLNGDEDLKEMEKAESKYLLKAKAEDVTEDWRIQNVWNGTMETYQEYQRLKDVDKVKANAFKNSKTNKRLFAARKAISAAKRKMNKAKKQMDGTNDAAKLVEIRNTRKELLKTLNGME
jgi:site-specific DNA-cytosine methylase